MSIKKIEKLAKTYVALTKSNVKTRAQIDALTAVEMKNDKKMSDAKTGAIEAFKAVIKNNAKSPALVDWLQRMSDTVSADWRPDSESVAASFTSLGRQFQKEVKKLADGIAKEKAAAKKAEAEAKKAKKQAEVAAKKAKSTAKKVTKTKAKTEATEGSATTAPTPPVEEKTSAEVVRDLAEQKANPADVDAVAKPSIEELLKPPPTAQA